MGKIKRPGVVVFASDDSGAPRYYIFKRSFSSPRQPPSDDDKRTTNVGVEQGSEALKERERGREAVDDTLGILCVTLDATNASYYHLDKAYVNIISPLLWGGIGLYYHNIRSRDFRDTPFFPPFTTFLPLPRILEPI